VRADYAEQEIMSRVQRLLDNPQLIEDLTASINGKRSADKKPLEQELQRLEKELVDTNRKKDKYYNSYEEDVLEPTELKVKINELSETRQRLENQYANLQNNLLMNNSAPISAEMVTELLTSFSTIFENIVRRQIIWREKALDSPFGVAEPNRINNRQ